MPVVQVNIIEGRSEQQKERLIKEVTDAVHRCANRNRACADYRDAILTLGNWW